MDRGRDFNKTRTGLPLHDDAIVVRRAAHLRFVLGRTQTHKDRSRRIRGCAIYDQILRDRAIFGRRFVALKFLSLETGQLPYPLLRPPTEPGTYITQFSARHVSLGMARSGSFQRDANSIQFNSVQEKSFQPHLNVCDVSDTLMPKFARYCTLYPLLNPLHIFVHSHFTFLNVCVSWVRCTAQVADASA